MGIVNAAGVFMPVFLVRIGGSNLEVSLLTAIPAMTGFLLAIPIGSYLQSRRNVVPWYSASRGLGQLVYALTAVAVALVPASALVPVVLLLWAAVTIPTTIGSVAFNELVTITIIVHPLSAGTITNTAVVAGREAEQDPSDNTASAATLVQGPFTPPSVCYSLRVTPRSLTVGRNSVIRVTVREAGKPIQAVRVVVTGKNLTRRARTNTAGVATIRFVPRRPGILQVRVPNHATCNRQRIGVVGVFTPPVTG